VQVYRNRIHTTDGVGVLVDGTYGPAGVYENTIEVQMGPKPEYGYAMTAWGIKCRTYPQYATTGPLEVHHNTIRVATGAGLVSAAGIGIYDSHPNLNNRYYRNDITAVTTEAGKEAVGIRLAGVKAADTGTRVSENTITSNSVNIDLVSADGAGPDGIVFESNTLIRGPSPIDYHTIDVGYWTYTSEGTVFVDTKCEAGASLEDIAFPVPSGGGAYSLSVAEHYVVTLERDGAPVAGATVTATPATGEPVVATTDAAGRASLLLPQWSLSGVTWPATRRRQEHGPYTMQVSGIAPER
jgi:hypothetical protein